MINLHGSKRGAIVFRAISCKIQHYLTFNYYKIYKHEWIYLALKTFINHYVPI